MIIKRVRACDLHKNTRYDVSWIDGGRNMYLNNKNTQDDKAKTIVRSTFVHRNCSDHRQPVTTFVLVSPKFTSKA